MKALIVDDNIAIQEILKDILIENGDTVRIAGSIDDAVDEIIDFRPDIILLDYYINEEEGIQILDRVHESVPSAKTDAILIKNLNDETPKDNAHIKAVVTKPFKSSDIIAAVNILTSDQIGTTPDAMEINPKEKTSFLDRISRKKFTSDSSKVEPDQDSKPLYGTSYVFFENEPDKVYNALDFFNPMRYSVLVITSDNAKAVKSRFQIDSIDVVTLSQYARGKSMDINALGTLMAFIKEYIMTHESPVVLIDNLTDVIDNNGMNRSLMFIHQLIKCNMDGKTPSFLVSVSQAMLTTKDRNILIGDMSEYEF